MVDKKHKRAIIDDILKYIDSRPAIVIYGARQVGKTTLLKYLMEQHIKDNAFYFDLEMQSLLELCNSGPEAVYNYLLQRGAKKGRIYLMIDEIQYLKNPTKFIKLMHDHFEDVKLLVSGSSTFEIRKKFRESLAGRTITFELSPLSFEEFLAFKGKRYILAEENSKAINDELAILAEEYIRFGGYPGVVLEEQEEKKQALLSQIINTYIRKDIRDIGNIRNIDAFNKLIEILASQSGQLLNVLELSGTLAINRETVIEYLNLLENTFIIKRISPFHKNLRSELSKNPKVFFMDTGMMNLLWLKEFPKVITGSAFETFVFLELMKLGKKINFWRTTNKQEIDFIVHAKEIYAVEAKLSFKKETKSLSFFKEKYKCKGAIIGLKGEKRGKYVWELTEMIKNG